MMFTQTTIDEIGMVASRFSLEPAALLAVADVESGGTAFATIGGTQKPLIRFEGHYFDRRLSGNALAVARAAGLASPNAGAIANPATQAARWRMLERAIAIDRKAACESVSWGLGQVMGAHWQWLGYADVDAFVAEAHSGVAGQARLMACYIEKAGLKQALKNRDWETFARGYNGPAYRQNGYHVKLAAAFRRYGGKIVSQPSSSASNSQSAMLRKGASGQAVRDLQGMLSALGYPLDADGIFGPKTEAAVLLFQRHNGLVQDGVVGPATSSAVAKALPLGNWTMRIWHWLSGLLRFA